MSEGRRSARIALASQEALKKEEKKKKQLRKDKKKNQKTVEKNQKNQKKLQSKKKKKEKKQHQEGEEGEKEKKKKPNNNNNKEKEQEKQQIEEEDDIVPEPTKMDAQVIEWISTYAMETDQQDLIALLNKYFLISQEGKKRLFLGNLRSFVEKFPSIQDQDEKNEDKDDDEEPTAMAYEIKSLSTSLNLYLENGIQDARFFPLQSSIFHFFLPTLGNKLTNFMIRKLADKTITLDLQGRKKEIVDKVIALKSKQSKIKLAVPAEHVLKEVQKMQSLYEKELGPSFLNRVFKAFREKTLYLAGQPNPAAISSSSSSSAAAFSAASSSSSKSVPIVASSSNKKKPAEKKKRDQEEEDDDDDEKEEEEEEMEQEEDEEPTEKVAKKQKPDQVQIHAAPKNIDKIFGVDDNMTISDWEKALRLFGLEQNKKKISEAKLPEIATFIQARKAMISNESNNQTYSQTTEAVINKLKDTSRRLGVATTMMTTPIDQPQQQQQQQQIHQSQQKKQKQSPAAPQPSVPQPPQKKQSAPTTQPPSKLQKKEAREKDEEYESDISEEFIDKPLPVLSSPAPTLRISSRNRASSSRSSTGTTRPRNWTADEERAVIDGYNIHKNHWSAIKKAYASILANRTSVNIKDKFRTLERAGIIKRQHL